MIACALSIILPVFLFIYAIVQHPNQKNSHTGVQGYIIGRRTTVSAFIGTGRYTITGYTSPLATVKLEGQGIYNETIANKNGRFSFNNSFAPLTPREVCITAIDVYSRITQPLCLPPFPVKQEIAIGPVILPPTLSVNQPEFLIHDEGILHGLSTPQSNVTISLAREENKQNIHLSATANDKGEYSITLPTTHKDTIYVTSRSRLNKLESIVSNALTLYILPWWVLTLQWIIKALQGLKNNIYTIVLITEAALICYLIWIFFIKKHANHPLALRPDSFLEEIPMSKKR